MNILSAPHGLLSLFHRRELRPPSGWQSTRDMQDSGELAPVEQPAPQTTGEMRLDYTRIKEWNVVRRKGRVRDAYEQYLMRPVQAPVYTLPAPVPRGTTGAFRPVRLVPDTGALPSMERPAWVEDLLRNGVQETPRWLVDEPPDSNWMNSARPVDVTPEDCAPVLDDCEPTELRKSVRDQRAIEALLQATKESEK